MAATNSYKKPIVLTLILNELTVGSVLDSKPKYKQTKSTNKQAEKTTSWIVVVVVIVAVDNLKIDGQSIIC